jgi:hypothetical protein
VRLERLEQPRADARDPIEPAQTAEGSEFFSIGCDGLGQPRTYPGKPGKLGDRSLIHIDPFVGAKRAGLLHGTVALGGR